VLDLVRTMHSDAELLATIYRIARETRSAGLHYERIGIRNAWRGVLLNGRAPLESVALHEARASCLSGMPRRRSDARRDHRRALRPGVVRNPW
jgi:hypothetical protein